MGYKGGTARGSGGGDFEKPAEKGYLGALVAYYPAGTHIEEPGKFRKERAEVPKMVLVYEIDAADSEGRPFNLFATDTDSLYKSARLRTRVEAALKRKLSDDEADEGFDMDEVLGVPVMVYVEHGERDGKAYIASVERLQSDDTFTPKTTHERMHRYVKKVLLGAVSGTVLGDFGRIVEGKPFFGPMHDADLELLGDALMDSNGGGDDAPPNDDQGGGEPAPDDDIPF